MERTASLSRVGVDHALADVGRNGCVRYGRRVDLDGRVRGAGGVLVRVHMGLGAWRPCFRFIGRWAATLIAGLVVIPVAFDGPPASPFHWLATLCGAVGDSRARGRSGPCNAEMLAIPTMGQRSVSPLAEPRDRVRSGEAVRWSPLQTEHAIESPSAATPRCVVQERCAGGAARGAIPLRHR